MSCYVSHIVTYIGVEMAATSSSSSLMAEEQPAKVLTC